MAVSASRRNASGLAIASDTEFAILPLKLWA